jgi:hypothetical protein
MNVKWYLHPPWTIITHLAHLVGENGIRSVGCIYRSNFILDRGTYLKGSFPNGNDYISESGAAL